MDVQSRDIGWGCNLQRLQRRYEAKGRVSDAAEMCCCREMTIELAGADQHETAGLAAKDCSAA
jgi:hypothetical protein